MQWFILLLLYVNVIPQIMTDPEHKEWSYTSELTNPKEWPVHWKKMCAGEAQSPINIDTDLVHYQPTLKPIQIYGSNDKDESPLVGNSGHTIQINFPTDRWYISFDGNLDHRYAIAQMHFHWGSGNNRGSEHSIDGRYYPLEVHIVAFRKEMYDSVADAISSPNGLAVLGILHKINDTIASNKTQVGRMGNFTSILSSQLKIGEWSPLQGFNLTKILDNINPGHYFRYRGSLTTPPCTENVMWTVFSDPGQITTDQIETFRTQVCPAMESKTNLVDNFRPTQPLNSETQLLPRLVYRAAGLRSVIFPSWLCLICTIGVLLSMHT